MTEEEMQIETEKRGKREVVTEIETGTGIEIGIEIEIGIGIESVEGVGVGTNIGIETETETDTEIMRDTGGEIETESVEKESVVEVEKNAGKAVVNRRRERKAGPQREKEGQGAIAKAL